MANLSEDEITNAADAELMSELSLQPSLAAGRPLFGLSVANMALRGTSMAARFLLMIGLAHYLTPSDFGIFSLMYASTTLGILFLGARFDVYSTRAICSGERTNAAVIIRDQIVFHLLVYVVVLPLMLLVFALGILPPSLIAWFYVLVVLEHAGQECNRLFVALAQPLRANFVFFVRSAMWAPVLIGLMFSAQRYRNLQEIWIWWTIGGVACLILTAIWMRGLGWRTALKERVDWGWIQRGLKPSAAFTVAIGASTIVGTVDRYFLGATWPKDFVGVYAFYSNLTNFVPTFAETGIVSILLPTLLAASAAGDWTAYEETMRKLTRGVWLVVTLTAALSGAIAPVVLILVKKAPIYGHFMPAFAILVASAVAATLAFIPHNALYARHKDKEIAHWSVISMVSALVCYAILTPRMGIYGVSIGSLVSSIVLFGGKAWAARKVASVEY